MSRSDAAKAAALEALQAGPLQLDPGDPRAAAVYLLKREGQPIISRNEGKAGQILMAHELAATDLNAEAIRDRRTEGLALALRWHRREPVKDWKRLIDEIDCQFSRDEASEYLRGIVQRTRVINRQ